MNLYIIRHAIAVPRGAPGVADDAPRPLTSDGARKMRKEAKSLSRLGIEFDQIWTSPYVRAHQTAEILAEQMGLSAGVRVVRALLPGAGFDALAAEICRHHPVESLALVGHEPDLGEFVTRLLTGVGTSAIRFKKGGIACVEIDDFALPLRGELCWLLTPRQLRSSD